MTEFATFNKSTPYALLRIAINQSENPELYDLYTIHVKNHNETTLTVVFPNSGFDLFIPEDVNFVGQDSTAKFVSLKVKAEMMYVTDSSTHSPQYSAYYMYPRSSMSKTPLLLANHTGIVDSGYRGEIIAALRNLSPNEYMLQGRTRLTQICHPSLCPILVEIVDENLLSTTERGSNGFGSTGIVG
jgi:dUTP pyrophosphatase